MKAFADPKMSWYPLALTLGGHLLIITFPLEFMAAQIITPSAFCTVGTVYLAMYLESVFLRQQRITPPGRTRNIFSSEKITLLKSNRANFLAKAFRLLRCTSESSGFFTALADTNPISCSFRWMVLGVGLKGTYA